MRQVLRVATVSIAVHAMLAVHIVASFPAMAVTRLTTDVGSGCFPAALDSRQYPTDPTVDTDQAYLALNGGGWGHGVGMSQYGAQGAALLGCSHEQMLSTFYPGTDLAPLATPREHIAVHLLRRGHEGTSIRTTSAAAGGRDLPWLACELDGGNCSAVVTQPPGTEWVVTPFADGTFALTDAGVDAGSCPVSGSQSAPQPTPDPTPTPTASQSRPPKGSDGDVARAQADPSGCHWRGGDIETRLRMHHDGTVIRVVDAGGRRVKWGFTEFDYTSVGGGTTYVTQYVTGAEDGSVTAIDRYLWGLAEMPSSWEMEALKTQAIAGRSYAEATIRTRESVFGRDQVSGYISRNECRCDIFATTVDQVYGGFDREESESGRWKEAVTLTSGIVASYAGNPISAFYSSSHGGSSEDVFHVWGSQIDYLPAVDVSRWEHAVAKTPDNSSGNTRDRWTVAFDGDTLASRLGVDRVTHFEIDKRGPGLRPTRQDGGGVLVKGVRSGTETQFRISGESLRSRLRIFSSLAFVVGDPLAGGEPTPEPTVSAPPAEPVVARPAPQSLTAACGDRVQSNDVRLPFEDVSETSPHRGAIGCLVDWNVTTGVLPDSFAPSQGVTRGQMATLIVRTIRAVGELPPGEGDLFTDDDGSSHESDIDSLATVGLVRGVGDGRFAPGQTVTRDQAATLIARTWEYLAGEELSGADQNSFADDAGSVHEAAINQAAQAGIVTGTGGDNYAPRSPVRRDQMASLLSRLISALVENGHAEIPSDESS